MVVVKAMEHADPALIVFMVLYEVHSGVFFPAGCVVSKHYFLL